ncbi:MAG TPA: RNA polymerase sigma factor [Fibrobacteria bacterium]|nr:RNA polymerase sigma factor [Fibrobacteria bacterium]
MNGETVENLYKRYGPLVLRRCRQLLRDPVEAEDALQEVFMQIVRNPRLLAAEFPSSLLYRIATNVSLNRLRGRSRRAESGDEEALLNIAAAEDIEQRSSARRLLDRIFNRHPESTRVMAVLHYVDGLTLEEVARETALSVSGVRKRLRALQATAGLAEVREAWHA